MRACVRARACMCVLQKVVCFYTLDIFLHLTTMHCCTWEGGGGGAIVYFIIINVFGSFNL